MSRPLKSHVIVKRSQQGMFHVERTVVCRCGWKATHYNAGHLKELFDAHKDAARVAASTTPTDPQPCPWRKYDWHSPDDPDDPTAGCSVCNGTGFVATPTDAEAET